MKLIWTTDVHFNSVKKHVLEHFFDTIKAVEGDDVRLLVTGDIGSAGTTIDFLKHLEWNIVIPIYFVAGNHDFYHGSIVEMRKSYGKLHRENCNLTYLTTCQEPVILTENTVLIGADGWYDGGYANWFKSKLGMQDYYIISELRFAVSQNQRYDVLQKLAMAYARHVKRLVRKTTDEQTNIIIATHVPPFRENSVYMGKISDDDWLPCFSSKIMGDAILELAGEMPNKQFTVLCGHSHGKALYYPTKNVISYTGSAKYGHPKINQIFQL